MYDTVYLYAEAIKAMLADSADPTNGELLKAQLVLSSKGLLGVTGDMTIDPLTQDRDSLFVLKQVRAAEGCVIPNAGGAAACGTVVQLAGTNVDAYAGKNAVDVDVVEALQFDLHPTFADHIVTDGATENFPLDGRELDPLSCILDSAVVQEEGETGEVNSFTLNLKNSFGMTIEYPCSVRVVLINVDDDNSDLGGGVAGEPADEDVVPADAAVDETLTANAGDENMVVEFTVEIKGTYALKLIDVDSGLYIGVFTKIVRGRPRCSREDFSYTITACNASGKRVQTFTWFDRETKEVVTEDNVNCFMGDFVLPSTTSYDCDHVELASTAGGVIAAFAVGGALLSLVCLAAVIKNRRSPIMKMSQVVFVQIACVGSFLLCLTNLGNIGENTDFSCMLRVFIW